MPLTPQDIWSQKKMMTPQSEEELAGMIAGATGPLAVQGGGTRGFAGRAKCCVLQGW